MSVIWSGITEQGAVVPVQVDASGKVIATASVPDEYVLRSGDTMTGPLVLPGDPTQELEAATKQYVDSTSGGPLGPHAWACVSGDGTILDEFGVARVSTRTEGVYFVSLKVPLLNNTYALLLTNFSANRYSGVTDKQSDGFIVSIYDRTTDALKSNTFNFVIYTNNPVGRWTYAE